MDSTWVPFPWLDNEICELSESVDWGDPKDARLDRRVADPVVAGAVGFNSRVKQEGH
jgi:hypothetical protein